MNDPLEALKAWLDKPGNTTLKLSAIMGYRIDSVAKWIRESRIPPIRVAEVLRIIGTKK